MKSDKIRDYAITLAVVVFIVTSLYNLYYDYQYNSRFNIDSFSDFLSAYPICDKFPDGNVATLTLNNGGRQDIKNIQCKVIDDGGLKPDKEQQTIDVISPFSEDVCVFKMKGNQTRPVRFEVKYNEKSIKTVCASFLEQE